MKHMRRGICGHMRQVLQYDIQFDLSRSWLVPFAGNFAERFIT